ncbi:glycoside hydrolase family 88 protein [Paenibacillus dokdonensis]|uniref:Glycoside hydrolase family 88 protein n=1 Tax=Paenibacillus dokdonensis TaxID=2567944 RepID=A0ABU6GL38_9BACL|nr:glycoside hydrolase family 88 protein [Paenibacillus dokdonensis]MEC0240104.1 glycoside hydrolase family 88 protein [Paenibacillus dokdonensis]
MSKLAAEKDQNLELWWRQAQQKVDRLMARGPELAPHAAKNGEYDGLTLDNWISGFWPGMLWIYYEMTGEEKYRNAAWDFDIRMELLMLEENRFHHDVGFQFLPTSILKYKLTNDIEGKRRGLAAANFLAGRFNLAGQYLRAWNRDMPGWAIIDCLMNLSLLFWAAEESGDPRFSHIAKAHADMALKHMIRPDGSTCHVAVFDPENGDFLEYKGWQGYAPDSCWSRGNAWALYGMANTYRSTGEIRYLHASQRVAHHFIASLPEDMIPPWDFRVPNPGAEPRDTSAAAIAASGLLELAALTAPEVGTIYRQAAERILASLSEAYAAFSDADHEGILRGATGHKPEGVNVNVSLIYGDYYYVESLAKLKGWSHRTF